MKLYSALVKDGDRLVVIKNEQYATKQILFTTCGKTDIKSIQRK